MADGTVEFYAELKYTSENAYLFTDGVDEFWIAKSVVINMVHQKGHDYEVEVPHWVAKKKGII